MNATVLVVDDDSMVRRAFARLLEHAGLTVIEAEDGEAGLDQARERAPDAVLLDLRMPGLDGLDVLSTMVEERPETPVFVVSGGGTMSDVVEALRRGAWDFILKPIVNSELLVRGIWRGLEKAALIRHNRELRDHLASTNRQLSTALDELRDDTKAARKLQFQLLPEDGQRFESFRCTRRLFPSQLLSGDFVDYFPIGEGLVGFYVADVAGHGAASAFVTAILTTLVKTYRERLLSLGDESILFPQRLLERLDIDLGALHLDKHVTMFFGVLACASGKLVYCNAGAFPFPFLANGLKVTELECAGRPLNLLGRGRLTLGEATLEPGARLLIASDGVLELGQAGGKSVRARREEIVNLMRGARDIDDVLAGLHIDESRPLRDDIALFFLSRDEHPHA